MCSFWGLWWSEVAVVNPVCPTGTFQVKLSSTIVFFPIYSWHGNIFIFLLIWIKKMHIVCRWRCKCKSRSHSHLVLKCYPNPDSLSRWGSVNALLCKCERLCLIRGLSGSHCVRLLGRWNELHATCWHPLAASAVLLWPLIQLTWLPWLQCQWQRKHLIPCWHYSTFEWVNTDHLELVVQILQCFPCSCCSLLQYKHPPCIDSLFCRFLKWLKSYFIGELQSCRWMHVMCTEKCPKAQIQYCVWRSQDTSKLWTCLILYCSEVNVYLGLLFLFDIRLSDCHVFHCLSPKLK